MRMPKERRSPLTLRPVLLKPMPVRITASAISGVREMALWVVKEPRENPRRAILLGTPIGPVYLPLRTRVASRWRTAMLVLIWASKPEILRDC